MSCCCTMCCAACAGSQYGVNCQHNCHCRPRDTCNPVNGFCLPSGLCHADWGGTACQTRTYTCVHHSHTHAHTHCGTLQLWDGCRKKVGAQPVGQIVRLEAGLEERKEVDIHRTHARTHAQSRPTFQPPWLRSPGLAWPTCMM